MRPELFGAHETDNINRRQLRTFLRPCGEQSRATATRVKSSRRESLLAILLSAFSMSPA